MNVVGVVAGVDLNTRYAAWAVCGGHRRWNTGLYDLSTANALQGLAALLTRECVTHVITEQPFLKDNYASAAKLAMLAGMLYGHCQAAGIVCLPLVPPTTWQHSVLAQFAQRRDELKRGSVFFARNLTGRDIASHDEADAVAIAHWGYCVGLGQWLTGGSSADLLAMPAAVLFSGRMSLKSLKHASKTSAQSAKKLI